MDETVDALSEAYDALVTAVVGVMEAHKQSGGQRTAATNAALSEFQRRRELFAMTCDEADAIVATAKTRLEMETSAAEETIDPTPSAK